jgi:iron complex outermembrane receptor protein
MRIVRLVSGAVLAMVALAGSAPAQERAGVLSGTVRDTEGRPLAGVQVMATALGRATVSDAAGRFVLRGIPAGTHAVRAGLIGYTPASLAVAVPGAEAAFVLRATPLSLEGIQVTGTASGKDALAVTQATTQLAGRALDRQLAATVAQTLAGTPGIRARYNGPAAAMPVMRGLTGDRVLMLQDGQRAADLAGSAVDHAVTIDPLAAQRIEVVRGPATLLYGNNALGGVVNVISDDVPQRVPSRTERSVALQSETAFPGVGGGMKVVHPLGSRWATTLRGGVRRTGDVRIGDDPVLGDRLVNTDSWSWNASAGLGYVGERLTLGGGARAYRFGYGLPLPGDEAGTPLDTVSLRGRRWEGALRGEWQTGTERLPSLRFDATGQDYAHDELGGDGSLRMDFGLRTVAANVVARQGRVGPLAEGAWGVSVLRKDYANTGPSALTPGAGSRAWGVFGYQEVALGEGGPSLQLGARWDDYGITSHDSPKFGAGVARSFRAFSGSAGLRVPLGAAASAAVSVARSFRAPTVEELFSGALHAGTGSVEYGTPTLRAERGLGGEAVLRVRHARWNGQFVAYRNRIADYVHLRAQPDTVVDGVAVAVHRYVQDDAVLQGLEGSLEWAAAPTLVLGLTGDYLHAEQTDGTPLSFMPPPRMGGFARWDDGRFSLGADVHHELRQTRVGTASESPTPAHTVVKLDAGFRFTRAGVVHSLALRGENLTNELHREATSRIKDFAPNPGRNVSLVYKLIF